MKTEEKGKTTDTDFKGPVSLDAILAATSKNKSGAQQETTATTTVADPPAPKKEKEEKKEEIKVDNKEQGAEGNNGGTNDNNQPPAQPQQQTEEVEETDAYKTALKMIKSGLLDDFVIQVSEEDEEGTPISEFKTMTDENLEEIIKIHKQESEKNISTNFISKEGLKEHQLKVIEILKNGGDLSQIADSEEKAFERPFEGFDLEVQERQIDVLYTDLVHQKGLKHDKAIALINASIKAGTLKEEAQEIFDAYRAAHANFIDQKLEEQRKAKEFKDLNFKENKKALTNKLKEAGFKESVYKKVASEYAKKNSSGDYALVDKLREALDNPEENHELILHLADKTLFNETFKIKAAQESQKTIVRLATGAASKGNRKPAQTQTSDENTAPWLKAAEAYNERLRKN